MRNRITGVAVAGMFAALLFASGGNSEPVEPVAPGGGVSADCIAPWGDDGGPGECPQ